MSSAMEIAVSLHDLFTASPFYDRFAKARQAGFSLVEIGDWTKLDLSRVTEELGRHSLRLSAMTGAGRFSLTDPDACEPFLEYLSQSIAVAKSFDCRKLVIQSADSGSAISVPKTAAVPESDADFFGGADFLGRAAAMHTLTRAAEKAARAGVTLFLKPAFLSGESFSYLHTNSSAGSLVRAVDSPALRLLFTFSLTHPIEDSVAATFGRYKDYIGYVHIGEANLWVIRAVLDEGLRYDGTVGLLHQGGMDEADWLREIAEVFGSPGAP